MPNKDKLKIQKSTELRHMSSQRSQCVVFGSLLWVAVGCAGACRTFGILWSARSWVSEGRRAPGSG